MLNFVPRSSNISGYSDAKVKWFVLTGGPCSGKTTALSRLERDLTNKGFKVFMVDEAATRVITSGITPKEFGNFSLQQNIAITQIVSECIMDRAIQDYISMPNSRDDIIVICDRGINDGKAYIDSDEEFSKLLALFGVTEIEAKDSYDGVIHLVTAANGAEEYYTLENNKARSESAEEARAIDKKTFGVWSGHPHIAFIDNSTTFDVKMDRVLEAMYHMIGAPIPIDSYRKYLISMPDLKRLERDFYCKFNRVEITRTYLVNRDSRNERSIIQRGVDGDYVFYYIEKRHFDGFDKIEVERRIDKKEYISLVSQADARLKQLCKTRYCFAWNNKYYELDVFDFWNNRAILKVQLTDRSSKVELPPIFNVLMDVTDDLSYSNYSLAQNIY